MNENVIKMARLMVGCKDRTCEDCLSQSKKLFGDNKCALIEYAEVLDNAGYRKQSDTVKEFANYLLTKIDNGIKDIKKHPYDSREETELFIRALECVRMDTENIAAEFGGDES